MRCRSLVLLVMILVGLPAVKLSAKVSLKKPQGKTAAKKKIDFVRDIQPIFARRCYSCHGAEEQEGGFRLNRKKAALAGGDSGKAIIPRNSAKSRLIKFVTGENDDGLRMPPETEGSPLSKTQIALLKLWIDQGAVWPDGIDDKLAGAKHWSFQRVHRPPMPRVKLRSWVRNPIDAFVLQALESRSIEPAEEADRSTLLRRASIDLLGLPPSSAEVEAFLNDDRPNAYERLIDRLLASPHFGERWGRHWLDLARYADSDGYEKDRARPHAWRFRHWVIEAINRDLPFDQFTIEQLAGDLLPGATTEQKVATGFHRNTLTNREGGVDREEDRVKQTVDRINTTGTVWLGLTVQCCQCHSHKYDPLSHREYYQLYAFFNSLQEVDIPAPLSGIAKDKSKAQTLIEASKPRQTHILIRGDFLRPGEKVESGTPEALPPLKTSARQATRLDLARWLVNEDNPLTARVAVNRIWQRYFGRGIVETSHDFGTQGSHPSHPKLLDWLASEFMARGWSVKSMHRLIVTSATYRQSSKLRPELLEQDPYNKLLARQHRFRVEAEVVRDLALSASGLVAHRIGGPSVRPPQPPGIDKLGYANSVKWVVSKGADRYRRGAYTFFQRTVPYPMFQDFDAPDGNLPCTRRERSNTPIAALTLQNDPVFVECCQAFARRLIRDVPSTGEPSKDRDRRLRASFRIFLSRNADSEELAWATGLFNFALGEFQAKAKQAAALAGKAQKPPATTDAELAAWSLIARTLMNLDEFITRE